MNGVIITTYIDEEFGKHFQVAQMNPQLGKILGYQAPEFLESEKMQHEPYHLTPVNSLFIIQFGK